MSQSRASCGSLTTGHCMFPVLTLSLPQGQLGSPRHPTSSWPPLDQFLGPCWEVQKSYPLLLQLDPELKGTGQEKMNPKSNLRNPHSGQRGMRNKEDLQTRLLVSAPCSPDWDAVG